MAEHRQEVKVGEMMTPLVQHEWLPGRVIRRPLARSMQEVEGRQLFSASCQRLSSPPGTSIPPSPVQQWDIGLQKASLQMVSLAKELRCLQLAPAYDSVR